MIRIMIRGEPVGLVECDITLEPFEELKDTPLGAGPAVDVLKVLSAAFIKQCNACMEHSPRTGRDFAVAKTNMETALLWAIKGAAKL